MLLYVWHGMYTTKRAWGHRLSRRAFRTHMHLNVRIHGNIPVH